jgi:hypothetical protein
MPPSKQELDQAIFNRPIQANARMCLEIALAHQPTQMSRYEKNLEQRAAKLREEEVIAYTYHSSSNVSCFI